MKTLTRILAVVLLSLSLFAGSASAECAWVLWTETEAMSSVRAGNWTSVSFDRNVYNTREACDAALVQWMEQKVQLERDSGTKVFRRDEESGDYKDRFIRIDIPLRRVTEVFRKKDAERLRDLVVNQYTCLPDTLDPRRPKSR